VAKDMAGFTPGEADTLRKAMGKKIAKLMAELKMKFIDGSVKNGVERRVAEEIFKQFEEFAAYGFNKSLAACYAMIAYQTAYLKAHYPDAFMAALLNSDCQNIDRVTIEVEECRRMGMEVLPPDVNESFKLFSVVKGTKNIRFGLLAIKGLGEDIAQEIYRERKEHGVYKELTDFAKRASSIKSFNRRSLESLIKSGALDRFGDRNKLFFNIETLLEYQKRLAREEVSGQKNLFSVPGNESTHPLLKLRDAPPASTRDILSWEKELLGLYVSAHPFEEIHEKLKGYLIPISQLKDHKKEKKVRIGGMLTTAKKILTKNNETMAFCKLEDMHDGIEVVVFPRVYNEKPLLWEEDTAVTVFGRVQVRNDELKFIAEGGFEITPDNIDDILRGTEHEKKNGEDETAKKQPEQAVTLYLRAQLPQTVLYKLRTVFDKYPGQYFVYFLVDQSQGQRRILSSYRIAFDELIAKELEAILGTDTVRMET